MTTAQYRLTKRSLKKDFFVTDYKLLGSGSYGRAYAGYKRSDNSPVIIRCVRKDHVVSWKDNIPLEIALMQKVADMPGLVRLLEYFETEEAEEFFALVMERPERFEELFDLTLAANKIVPEALARPIFKQILTTVDGMFQRGVFHGDIRQENVLLNLETGQTKLLVSGVREFHHGFYYEIVAGSPLFFPPEWFRYKKYKAMPAAVWGLGVLLYSMLCGKLPFKGYEEIVDKGEVNIGNGFSPPAQSLLRRCLCKDPSLRPSLEWMLKHPWTVGMMMIDPPSSGGSGTGGECYRAGRKRKRDER